MCTVTLVPLPGESGVPAGIRFMCNRDESRDRPAALAPVTKTFNRTRAVFPVDAVSEGTWVAVNDAGLIMTLLNRNPTDMRGVVFPGKISRGGIIPSLLHADSLAQALELIDQIDGSLYPPFRLVVADTQTIVDVVSGADGLAVNRDSISYPVMLTSSGLGDEIVEGPRRRLFNHTFEYDRHAGPAQQDEYHRHQWGDHPELSVAMEREDAITVSVTTIDLSAQSAVLTYRPAPPWVDAEDFVIRLPLPRAAKL